MEFSFWFGVLFIVAAVSVALFVGDMFINTYLKAWGGKDKFYYHRWKYCVILQLLLGGIGFFFWSSVVGPILLLLAVIIRPVLVFTYCRKKQQ